jgi:dTDP-4-amino-4,6-dideoxygalactose transaminase
MNEPYKIVEKSGMGETMNTVNTYYEKAVKLKRIPFTRPSIGKEEIAIATKALLERRIGGNGFYTKIAEDALSKKLKAKYAYLTTSATHALEMAVMCLGIGPGDEVICPSFTFVSTANAILRQGAVPRFCDIEPRTLNIDIAAVKRLITKKTKAIIPVHYAGTSCDMDELMKLGSRYGLAIIEDAAQAIGARYKGRSLGTIGDIGALSFHITKNITCGEGGAFLTNSDAIAKKADIVREKGTNRNAFLKGEVDKYTWLGAGSSFIPSDLLAAILIEQLKRMERINRKRVEIFNYYLTGLMLLKREGLIDLPEVPEFSTSNGHIFWFLVKRAETRDALIEMLKREGISATFHYVPLHTSPYGKKRLGYKEGDFPVTESVSRRLVRLPLFSGLSQDDAERVSKAVTKLLREM